MSGHRMGAHQDKSGRWFGVCNCGWSSGPNHYLHRWQAEDQIMVHQGNVNRARASLRFATGTLQGEYNHATAMAADPNVPEREREMWRGLAQGYASRLGRTAEEDGLF